MRILAWETAGLAGSVAALVDGRIELEKQLPATSRSAQSLAPALHALLAEVGWQPANVELVATALGPGSFTGLRIGLTLAKLFAYAVGCPLIGVNTLEAIAARAPDRFLALSVAIDAQRKQVFTARFQRNPAGELAWSTEAEVQDNDAWLAGLDASCAATGPALAASAGRLPADVPIVPSEFWALTAAAVGQVGWRRFSAGERHDPFQLLPVYSRRTAAEEQWEGRGGPERVEPQRVSGKALAAGAFSVFSSVSHG